MKIERLHSMDALRASTMLLLVPAHAAILLAVNGHGGAWATGVYWFLHVFRMPLFFAMAGLFGVILARRYGIGGATRNRLVRVGIPLGLGVLTLVPLYGALANWLGVTVTADGGRAYVFVLQPSYLWFLWYLVILYAIALALSWAGPAAGRRVEAIASHPLGRWAGLLGLILCTAALLWPHREWFAPPPAHFDPDPYVLGYYGLFFGLGAFLADSGRLRALATPRAWRWLAAALVLVVPAGFLYALRNRAGAPPGDAIHAAALLTLAATTWTSLFALIGLAGRYLPERRPALRYVADSSYWIYLIHLQVMVCLIAALKPLALPTAAFFVVLVAVTSAISFALYPFLVRYTIIGRVLHGPRRRPPPAAGPALTPRAAAASPPA